MILAIVLWFVYCLPLFGVVVYVVFERRIEQSLGARKLEAHRQKGDRHHEIGAGDLKPHWMVVPVTKSKARKPVTTAFRPLKSATPATAIQMAQKPAPNQTSSLPAPAPAFVAPLLQDVYRIERRSGRDPEDFFEPAVRADGDRRNG